MTAQQSLSIQKNLTIRLLRVLRYNKARVERALTLLPKEHEPLFHVLPFLLHVNHPRIPGYVESSDVPFGINNYSLRQDIANALSKCFPDRNDLFSNIKQIWPRQRSIDALVLMGSIGTIAQTNNSDFDYWVCIDSKNFSPEALLLLQKKLSLIEWWAEHEFNIEVHFFLSEIDNVRNNDFGIADGESAGSAQALFLKAEFYTTNIVVAGKVPFWWLTPEKTNDQQYYALHNVLEKGGSPDLSWFMDLGNLERLDAKELFGAAIWQLSKAIDSPFKSVLKIAKLEVYLADIEQGIPLCNLLKKHVHRGEDAPGNVAVIDPYALMFDQLIEHYEKEGQPEDILLLQQCLYLKCGCKLSEPLKANETPTFKRKIIAAYAKRWGWTRKMLYHLDNQSEWSFHERMQLSRLIHRFLLKCYRRISSQLDTQQQAMDKKDMAVLGRRLSTFYAKRPNKIEYLRCAFEDNLYCECITVALTQHKDGSEIWSVYAGEQFRKSGKIDPSQRISQASSAIELIIWCILNRIIDAKSKVILDYNSSEITETDLNDIAKQLCHHFPPVKVSSLPRNDLLTSERITKCLVFVNFPTSRHKATVEDVSVLYSTSWGETFLIHGKNVLDTLWFELQEVSPPPPCYVMVPRGNQQMRIHNEFTEFTKMTFSPLY